MTIAVEPPFQPTFSSWIFPPLIYLTWQDLPFNLERIISSNRRENIGEGSVVIFLIWNRVSGRFRATVAIKYCDICLSPDVYFHSHSENLRNYRNGLSCSALPWHFQGISLNVQGTLYIKEFLVELCEKVYIIKAIVYMLYSHNYAGNQWIWCLESSRTNKKSSQSDSFSILFYFHQLSK